MIVLTKLDGVSVAINEDLLVFAEKTPDTVLTMTSGHRLMVRESLDTVIERITDFRRRALPTVAQAEVTHG